MVEYWNCEIVVPMQFTLLLTIVTDFKLTSMFPGIFRTDLSNIFRKEGVVRDV